MAAELASAEEDLVAAAAQHFSSNCGASVLGFQFPPDSSLLWVKYSLDGDNMRAQARTQAFAFHQLAREGIGRDKRVRVPEIYQVFESEIAEAGHPHRYVFIVMEYIPGISVRDALYEHGEHHSRLYKVADALAALVDLPPPPDARPGPVGGGLIRNFTFAKEYEEHESDAPREFLDLKDLEDYVNKANVVVRATRTRARAREQYSANHPPYAGKFRPCCRFYVRGPLSMLLRPKPSKLPHLTWQRVCGRHLRHRL